MTWFIKNDKTSGVITAKNHIESKSHKDFEVKQLPENAIVFCMGKWNQVLSEAFDAKLYLEKLKRFLGFTEVYKIADKEDWCFLHGGPGSPVCADTLETIHELGVKRAILVGMVGGFGLDCEIGDVVVPYKILSREGTSIHYCGKKNWAVCNTNIDELCGYLTQRGFRVFKKPTVSCDAVFRQTYAKERVWRKMGCVGIDCEGSAFLNVGKFLGMQVECVFLVSDKHPADETIVKNWEWGVDYNLRKKFISAVVDHFVYCKVQ